MAEAPEVTSFWVSNPYCGCQFERGGGSQKFHRKGGKIAENRTLRDVNQTFFPDMAEFLQLIDVNNEGGFRLKRAREFDTQNYLCI